MEEAINVGLYGAGTRKSRLRAEYIYCDYAEECLAYKQNKCFCVTTPFKPRCKIGRVVQVDGATKQSKKYYKIYNNTKEMEIYNKLDYPRDLYFTKTKEKMYLSIPYIRITPLENGDIKLDNPFLSSDDCLLESKHITTSNLIKILSFEPRAVFGGIIEDYQEKIVPDLLTQIKKYMPEYYQKIIELKPKFKELEPDYVGKYAKISTCNKEMKYGYGNNVFHFEGDYLVCNDYISAFLPFGAKKSEIKIKVEDNMYVEITNNKQVLEDTIFK